MALGIVESEEKSQKTQGEVLECERRLVPTPHDLRRTAASMMTAASIPRLHVDRLLNHIDSSVGATYDRHDYWPEKGRAVEVWEARLFEIVEGMPATGNVVPFQPVA